MASISPKISRSLSFFFFSSRRRHTRLTCDWSSDVYSSDLVRDFLTEEIDEVLCDNRAATNRMIEMVGQISRRARNRIHFYDAATPIFETYGMQKQIDDAFHRQVWLRCGGYIVIDETEALVAIDVNTGRNKGGRDVEKTILQTNLEAADEIA